ncbi:SEL1-like repeat protein [Inquilinus limosus]|nr:SEL1-like repeat protein [Inquilinus limosus]
MNSLADDVTRRQRRLIDARGATRCAVAALFACAVAGCSTLDDLGIGWGDSAPAEASTASSTAAPAPPPGSAVPVPAVMAAAVTPEGPGTAGAAVDDPAAQVPLPDGASAELRELVRRAEAGDTLAEYGLGTRFANGTELPQSPERAAYWYRRAAEQGMPDALYALGVAYRDGIGVTGDAQEAMTWFRKASLAGRPRGAYEVGRLYEGGQLGPPNPRIAAGWYRIAAHGGDEPAKEALARLQAGPDAGAPAMLAQTSQIPSSPDRRAASRAAPPTAAAPSKAPAAQPSAAPERPATGAEIREIQQLLASLNLDPGQPDGRLRPKTRLAIATFQRGQGLPVTGQPSAEVLEALRAATAAPRFD